MQQQHSSSECEKQISFCLTYHQHSAGLIYLLINNWIAKGDGLLELFLQENIFIFSTVLV